MKNESLSPPPPIHTLDLFAEDRAALLALLRCLTPDEWERPTVCAGWTVKDVALHILGGDIGNLSWRRDQTSGVAWRTGETIVDYVNRLNDEWMHAARRFSIPVLIDLLDHVGPPLFDYFASLDLDAYSPVGVSWAGDHPARMWLDVAREFTERWSHQQHIRDAVGKPGQTDSRFLAPVLAAFVHALHVTYRDTMLQAQGGFQIHLAITGEAGGAWTLTGPMPLTLWVGKTDTPTASVTLDQETAWRLFTKGISPEVAQRRATITGNVVLGALLFNTVSIIA